MQGYTVELSSADLEDLRITPSTPVGLLAIITVRDNPHRITANLLGPLVINREDGLGKQVVLSASDYSLQHPLNPES